MIKALRLFSILILLLTACSLISCSIFDRGDKDGHICSFDTVEVKSELSCTTDGITVRRCYCGRETTEVKPAYGHSFDDWKTISEASCDAPGLKENTCVKCGAKRSQVVERLSHNYTVTEETHDGVAYNRYTCNICNESFIIDAGLDLPQIGKTEYILGCEKNFSFIVISTEDEEYIKNNLKIFDFYFSDSQSNNEFLDYNLTSLSNNRWLVEPKNSYEDGETYIAMRTEGVYFEKYGFCDLVFSVFGGEEVKNVSLNKDIIYIAALEKESPGYYPYSFQLSKESGGYFLSLEKADGLNAGDIICVGPASDFGEILSGSGNNTIGVIESITGLDDGRTLILLKELAYNRLFGELEIRTSTVSVLEELNLPLNIEDRIRTSLLNDKDFARLVSLFYEEGLVYLESIGLESKITDFEEFLSTVKIIKDDSNPTFVGTNGKSASHAEIGFSAVIKLPAAFDNNDVGELEAVTSINIKIRLEEIFLGLKPDEYENETERDIDISFDVKSTVDTLLLFNIYSAVEFTPDIEVLLFEKETDLYHYNGCEAIKKTGKNYVTPISIYEVNALINSGEDCTECSECRPLYELEHNIHLIDTKNKVYHTAKCSTFSEILKKDLIYTEKNPTVLEREGYNGCPDCNNHSVYVGDFADMVVNRIKKGDKGIYTDQIMESAVNNDDLTNELVIAAFSTTLSGIDRQIIPVYISFDFGLEPVDSYEYKITRTTAFSLRTNESGLKKNLRLIKEETNLKGFYSSDTKLPFTTKVDFTLFIAGFTPQE